MVHQVRTLWLYKFLQHNIIGGITMRLETILYAYDRAGLHEDYLSGRFEMRKNEKLRTLYYRRVRQRRAFRARILRMDAEKDEQEAMLRLTIDELRNEIADLEVQISILHGAIDRR